MIRDEYADDEEDYNHFVRKPRLEECAMDAALGNKQEDEKCSDQN